MTNTVPHTMQYPHQDWDTVILRGRKELHAPRETLKRERPAGQLREEGTPAWKIERRADAESGSPVDRVSRAEGAEIARARTALGMSQSDLARRVNAPAATINEIERGVAVRNGPLLAKIRAALK